MLLLVFLFPLTFALFSSPAPSLETSSCFRFLVAEVLTLITVEVPRPAFEIWVSATVQSAESVSIAYLQRKVKRKKEREGSNRQPKRR